MMQPEKKLGMALMAFDCFALLVSIELVFCLFPVTKDRAHLLILAPLTFAFGICEWQERILNRGRLL